MPSVNLQKYRLVSAIMKVKYNGSVIEQAGTMYSAATFAPFNTFIAGYNGANTDNATLVANSAGGDISYIGNCRRYSQTSLVRNGLWNYSQNITSDATGIECLYVPTDPLSQVFYDSGRYHGTTYENNIAYNGSAPIGFYTDIKPTVGSPISYIVHGLNMKAGSKC